MGDVSGLTRDPVMKFAAWAARGIKSTARTGATFFEEVRLLVFIWGMENVQNFNH
jgi:hypothetical protein